ncbi:MAG: hypothetical protein Q7K57_51565 [Burkholderiaceae bacterium]|nr:hypothetical protein [Burkholderiaceae bacterium]
MAKTPSSSVPRNFVAPLAVTTRIKNSLRSAQRWGGVGKGIGSMGRDVPTVRAAVAVTCRL